MRKRLGLCAALLLTSCATPQREIAITIDDLPVHAPYPPGVTPNEVNDQMIAALAAAHVPAIAFVNGIGTEQYPGSIQALRHWRSAGFPLGNHTWSHPHLSELTLDQFEVELTKGEPLLSRLDDGSDWHWFRYPFLDEGKDEAQRIAARQVLARHDYGVAAVTMSFADWAWTPAYSRCTAKQDMVGIAKLEQLYLAAVRKSIADDRKTARKLYGRDIPYVLLMHVSAMSAHMMPRVIQLYRDAGFRFVTIREAESDPAYAAYTDLALPPPPSRGEAAQQKRVKLPAPPDYSATLNEVCA
jgi:peptidoglycan/xylan/chitin deacetylase (PgdA/CDA1 family)